MTKLYECTVLVDRKTGLRIPALRKAMPQCTQGAFNVDAGRWSAAQNFRPVIAFMFEYAPPDESHGIEAASENALAVVRSACQAVGVPESEVLSMRVEVV